MYPCALLIRQAEDNTNVFKPRVNHDIYQNLICELITLKLPIFARAELCLISFGMQV